MNRDNYKEIRSLAQNINTELQSYVSEKNKIDGIMEVIKSNVCDQTNMEFLNKYYTDEKALAENIEFLAKSYINLLMRVADELEFDAHIRERWVPQDIGY